MIDQNVEVDRRKKETGLREHIVEIFIGKQSRKVAFGVWWFWVATVFRIRDLITPELWWYCSLSCALLIGFGTILDDFLAKLGDKITVFVAEKVNAVITPPPPTS